MSGPLALLAATSVVLAAALIPGAAWVLASGPTNRSRAESVGTALALSPGLLGGAVALLLAAHVPPRAAGAIALATFVLAALAAALVRRSGSRPGAPSNAPDARLSWVVALGVTLLVALLPASREWWRLYSDAWNHAAITRAVTEHGVHPFDPFFAGQPLQYAIVYHAQMAAVRAVTGADTFVLMASWSAFALAGVLLCAGPAAARLHGRAQGASLAMLLFGLNAAFPWFTPLLMIKGMVGDVRGWPEIARMFTLAPFGVMRTSDFLHSLNGADYFLNKFMVATPFALGLGALAALTACFIRWLDHRNPRELWIAAGAMLGAGIMHPVFVIAVVPAALALAGIALAAPKWAGVDRTSAAGWAAAVTAGALPAALYTASIIGGQGGSHRELPIDVSPLKFLGLVSTLALGLLLAWRPVREQRRLGGPRRAWGLWLGLQLAIAAVIRLPGLNSFFTIDKFGYLVWIPLALTAGLGLESLLARRGAITRLALVLLVFGPVNGLALAARVCDPLATARQPWDLPAFVWMRSHLPADAVLVVPYGDPVTVNYVGRDQYLLEQDLSLQLGYPDTEVLARRSLVERFYAADSLTPDELARLRSLRRPVFAVWTRFADPRFAVTPRTIWWGLSHVPIPDRRPQWSGRYRIAFASETHVVAELVPAPVNAEARSETSPR